MDVIEKAYTQHARDVYRYLFSLSHDEDLAEELTQETFLRAMKTVKNYDGSCKLSVWLCQIGKHLWYQWLEKHAKYKTVELTNEIPNELSSEKHVLLRMEKAALYKAIHSLPEPMREVVHMRLTGEFSFDENRMLLMPVQAVLTTDDYDDSITLSDLDHADFETSKAVISGNYDTLDLLQFTYRGINHAGFTSCSRTISRNGEKIRVVFFCYYKTLWDIVLHGDLAGYSESGSAFGDVYEDSMQKDHTYIPGMKEIYYLPIRNLHKISDFSGEEFDALRDKAELIWKGII